MFRFLVTCAILTSVCHHIGADTSTTDACAKETKFLFNDACQEMGECLNLDDGDASLVFGFYDVSSCRTLKKKVVKEGKAVRKSEAAEARKEKKEDRAVKKDEVAKKKVEDRVAAKGARADKKADVAKDKADAAVAAKDARDGRKAFTAGKKVETADKKALAKGDKIAAAGERKEAKEDTAAEKEAAKDDRADTKATTADDTAASKGARSDAKDDADADKAASKGEREADKAAADAATAVVKGDREADKAAADAATAVVKGAREDDKAAASAAFEAKKAENEKIKAAKAEIKDEDKKDRKDEKIEKLFAKEKDCSAHFSIGNATHIVNPKHPKPSLAFCMDFSGSMGGVLAGIIAELNHDIDHGIIDSSSESGAFHDGVVVGYSDPSAGMVGKPATSVAEFHDLINRITISSVDGQPGFLHVENEGGGDCPEYAFAAIAEAIDGARPYSRIMVFTDASGKDTDNLPRVRSLMAEKHAQIIFVLNAIRCNGGILDQNYRDLAMESRGHVFRGNTADIRPIVNAVKNAQLFENWVAGFTGTGVVEMQIPTPNSITDITITVSGGAPTIECRHHDGTIHTGHTDILDISRVLIRTFPRGYMQDVDRVSGFNHHLYCTITATMEYSIEISSGNKGCDHDVTPCLNGGKCRHISRCDLFQCKCQEDYFGVYCEKHIDDDPAEHDAPSSSKITHDSDGNPIADADADWGDDEDDWGEEEYPEEWDWGSGEWDFSMCAELCEGEVDMEECPEWCMEAPRSARYRGNVSGDLDRPGHSEDVIFTQHGDPIPDIDDGFGEEPAGFQ